jgi:hypothetical protein
MCSKVRSFKTFYEGACGKFLRPFFPKMPSHTAFLKQLKNHSKKLWALTMTWDFGQNEQGIHLDSTPFPVCEDARSKTHKVFRGMAQWAYSSTEAKFGLKMHLLVDENQRIKNFVLKPENMHNGGCAEEVLKNFRGTGDKGYCSIPLAKRLLAKGIRLVARHRKNMEPNSAEEKELLRKRPLVKTVIGKIRNFFCQKLSRFRSPQAAFSAICAGVPSVNLGC